MAGNIGIPSNTSIDELFTSVQIAWSAADFTKNSINEQLSTLLPGGIKAPNVSIAFVNSTSAPVEILMGADQQYADPEVFKTVVQHTTFGPRKGIQLYEQQLRSDVYGILQYQNLANEMLAGARNLWKNQLAIAITSNILAFDGLPMFSTVHPVNPLDPGLGTYSNDIAGVDLDEAGLAAALDALRRAPWFDGQLDSSRLGDITIVVPNESLYLKAIKLVGLPAGSLIPMAGTVAGTSVAATSPFMSTGNQRFKVVLLDELINYGGLAAFKQWYVMNTGAGTRGFITSIVTPPTLSGEWGYNTSLYNTKYAHRMTWSAFGGVGAGLPREVVRATLP